jgi:hypothetical protein
MAKIWIFGDSFSSSKSADSWTQLLSPYGQAVIKSSNGSSEYRIWKTYQENKNNIDFDDRIIFCHTSYSRVFLKNSETLLSRLLPTHPLCDLIFSDVLAKNENKFVKILKTIWDDDYFKDTYDLLLKDLKTVPRSIHINFFEPGIYNSIWEKYPGKINHLDSTGNLLVVQQLARNLS